MVATLYAAVVVKGYKARAFSLIFAYFPHVLFSMYAYYVCVLQQQFCTQEEGLHSCFTYIVLY